MGALCEMAWNQGDDLYSYDGRRFMNGRRLLLDDKYISQMCFSVAPEGGGGDYGTTSGGFDQLGFGTLMYAK
jgi:hypothetical protein